MLYTKKIKDAVRFAIQTHQIDEAQKRKGKDIPYVTHPLTVGLILACAGATEDIIVAGILHDTIEDSVHDKNVARKMLVDCFGEEITALVDGVTERDKSLPWEDRKREALSHIRDFSQSILLVKSADVISNATELIDDYGRDGESVFARFNAPKEKMLKYDRQVITAITETWPGSPFTETLREIATALEKIESNSLTVKNE